MALEVTLPTVLKIRKRFAEGALEAALSELPRLGSKPKFDAKQAAIESQPSPAPQLRLMGIITGPCACWAPRLWRSASPRPTAMKAGAQAALKNELKPWQKQQWCIAKKSMKSLSPSMEEVSDTYMYPLDEHHPVVCFGESPFQLLREVREPLNAASGRLRRVDYEYERCGVAEVMIISQPAAGMRKCMVTQHRKKTDFAGVLKEIDRMFPAAHRRTVAAGRRTHVQRQIAITVDCKNCIKNFDFCLGNYLLRDFWATEAALG